MSKPVGILKTIYKRAMEIYESSPHGYSNDLAGLIADLTLHLIGMESWEAGLADKMQAAVDEPQPQSRCRHCGQPAGYYRHIPGQGKTHEFVPMEPIVRTNREIAERIAGEMARQIKEILDDELGNR